MSRTVLAALSALSLAMRASALLSFVTTRHFRCAQNVIDFAELQIAGILSMKWQWHDL